jgi:integrase/recombinase XerC
VQARRVDKGVDVALSKWPVAPAWADWIEGWSTALRAAGRAGSTIASRRQVLAQLSREVTGGPGDVTTAALLEWMGLEVWDVELGRLRPRWSVERRRAVRAALAGFYRWAHGTGRVEVDPALGLPAVRPSDGLPRPAPLASYLDALTRADDAQKLMLVLACELGMRRAEVAQVHTRDVVEDLAGSSLIVHGKGGRQRSVPIGVELASRIRNLESGYVFPGRCDGHLSPRWVGRRISLLLGGDTTMHQLRHLFATVMLRRGANLVHVQRTMGHRSLATTQRYLYVEDDELRRAVGAVHEHLNSP